MSDKKPLTHTAYALKREGRTAFRWLEIGAARIEDDGTGNHQVYVDRLPVGGFSGRIHLSPIGTKPPDPTPQPRRPDEAPADIAGSEGDIQEP
jgi:hypothetical protein